ncbi:cyclin-L1-like [Anneissia japonica]|uniref:cyclin-L1-like n=1 Tax=Anneissia japonica TaxID=1529436 RepID=UPI0014259C1F|nr:cyclin-L1-like [Anneissia japonica]
MADTKTEANSVNGQEKTYGRVVITLENCIIPSGKLSPTPSVLDGLDIETETDLRILGCEFIQMAGILLKLPQVAMATSEVLFQRFYYSKSFIKHNMEVVAMACVYLASKIEEAPRRIRDVINVFHHIRQKRNNRPVDPLVLDAKYVNLKSQVIKAERRVLKELGFCVHVKHPHKMIVTFLQVLECERNTQLVQTAWNYMNDCLRTDVFVRYAPETIACSCIYLSARQLDVPLPNNPPWYDLLNTNEEELQQIAITILALYTRKKRTYEELDKIVEKCKMNMQEAKLKAKGISADTASTTATPTSFSPSNSRPGTPKPAHNSPGLPNSYKVHKNRLKNDEARPGSDGSYKEKNGRPERRGNRSHSRSSQSSSRSRSHSPRHRMLSRSISHSDHHSRSSSRSTSPHKRKDHRIRSPHSKHRRRDRHPEGKSRPSHSRKRKPSHSASRSRSRSPISHNKHRYSPQRDSTKKYKHRRRSSSPSRHRSHKTKRVSSRDSRRRR